MTQNKKQIEYRGPCTKDAEGIIKYLYHVAGETENLSMGQEDFPFTVNDEVDLIYQINSDPNKIMILAMDGEKIVGLLTIFPLTRKRLAHRGDLGITVRQSYWRQGIGKNLMVQALEAAKAAPNLEMVYLEVLETNQKAIDLYEKMGFTKIGVIQKSVKLTHEGRTEYRNMVMMQNMLD